MGDWKTKLWAPGKGLNAQPLVRWAKEAANTEDLLRRIQSETGRRVAHSTLGHELARMRNSGLEIPNFRYLYGTANEAPEPELPVTEGGEAASAKLEKKLATARGSLDQERKRTRALQKELDWAQKVIDFRAGTEGVGDEIAIEPPRRLKKSMRAGTPVIMASDWHVEETVDARKVNWVNEYNPEIAERRAAKFFQGATHKVQQASREYDCSQAILWFGGDLISGFLHESNRQTNAMSPIQAVLFLKGLLRAGIDMMLEELSETNTLHVVCNYGNHGRTTKKPVDGAIAAANSFEYGAYQDLRQHYEGNPRVNFRIAEGTLEYVKVYDWSLRFTHGDKGVKFRDAIGGISTAARKAVMGWDTSRKADYTIMGHWHSWQTPFSDIIVNGSLIGYNAFAQDIKARWEPPQQGFWVLDAERGRRHTESIWVSSYGARKPLQ